MCSSDLPGLTLVAGLAICEAIQAQTDLPVRIKWPNDIVLNGKKICGILCEMQANQEGVQYAVVGVGVNVNTDSFPTDLPYASSLYRQSGIKYDREPIIESFCTRFDHYYRDYQKEQNLGFLLENYKSNCITLNNKVKIINNQQTKEAEAQDITKTGELFVQYEDGTEECILAGEVSVRGLYDYI